MGQPEKNTAAPDARTAQRPAGQHTSAHNGSKVNVLLVGGGAREHALGWALSRSPNLGTLHVTHRDNPGLAALGQVVDVPVNDEELYRLEQYCDQHRISLVVIGPEDPLANGWADRLASPGRAVFGPSAQAAQLEADKAWCKAFLNEALVPTASGRSFTDIDAAIAYLHSRNEAPVIKAAGLAAGKGVVLPDSLDQAQATLKAMMVDKVFGQAGSKVVIEERLNGREVSVFAITDGRTIHILLPCQDHKRLGENDVGPNTGGMGVLCPSDAIDSETMSVIEREILVPTIDALKRDKIEYKGVLYAGLMLTPSGPKVIEYNVRFGDPECQTLMVKLKSDVLEVMLATTNRSLGKIDLDWDDQPAVCVVLASQGYPQSPRKGDVITGTEQAAAMEGVEIFYAGVKRQNPNDPTSPLITAGGRVLSVVAKGDDWEQARQRAYRAADVINFAGKYMRRDIGSQYAMHATTDSE